MGLIETLMNAGTILAALGTLPNIVALWKDRTSLRGYNWLGALCLFFAMSCFFMAFYIMEIWISMFAQLPPMAFWLIASTYSYVVTHYEKGLQRKGS